MLIQTNSGDYIDLDAIEDSRLPPKEENYKQTANEFYGKERPKKPKQDKVYSIFQIQKILRERYNYQLQNITGYKGNRFIGYNTYRVLDQYENKVMDGSLHDIGEWLEEKGVY